VNESKAPEKGSLLSAAFLVAGCCVGGGMLALPVGSGTSGFFPSLGMMVICWLCMTLSALMLMEVSLWMEEGAHVITMTSRLLGRFGKVIAWILFLYISYASEVAYAAGGGVLVSKFLGGYLGYPISRDLCAALVAVIFTGVIMLGGTIVGRVNSILFVALVASYFGLVTMGTGEVKTSYLFNQDWSTAFLAIPLLLTAFSFQTMVPSLTPILKQHTNAMRFAIIGGTTIALVIYVIWQFIILGIIPQEGPHGIIAANLQSLPATHFLQTHVDSKWFVWVAEFFGFFALVTSYLAIGLGLFDFLSDGLKIPKKGLGIFALGAIIIIPTVVSAIFFERAFMVALETSGGYGDTILNGMIPVAMVWIGRYRLGYMNPYRVPGGKPVLVGVFCFFLASLMLEILLQLGILPLAPTEDLIYKFDALTE
jgi:tyrosine-specific transport protein